MRSKVEKPQKLQKDYDDLHKEWLDYLLTGFNVLVRGRGSKVKVVESFCEKYLSEKDVLQVYGHTPGETLKSILQKIINKFKLGIKLLPSAMIKNANEVSEAIEEHKRERYLIIHNLDAPGLRDPLILEIFSILVRGKYLRLVSTLCCDCGDIYWNQELKRSMRLVDYTVKTNEYEQEEFFDLNPKLAGTKGKKTGVHTMESLDMIWTALPSNAQRIFIRLYELDSMFW
ncbi:Origin recognition complex subunit 2 [Aphelenchoides bicaudatus]|nr:Origin recognition complex subunit 2 [Aphelenchoides bicaudatus]